MLPVAMQQQQQGGMSPSTDERMRCCGRRFWFVRDICGIICALMTWLLVLYAQYVVVGVILLPALHTYYGAFHLVLFELLAFLAVFSHVRTMVTDPVSPITFRRPYSWLRLCAITAALLRSLLFSPYA